MRGIVYRGTEATRSGKSRQLHGTHDSFRVQSRGGCDDMEPLPAEPAVSAGTNAEATRELVDGVDLESSLFTTTTLLSKDRLRRLSTQPLCSSQPFPLASTTRFASIVTTVAFFTGTLHSRRCRALQAEGCFYLLLGQVRSPSAIVAIFQSSQGAETGSRVPICRPSRATPVITPGSSRSRHKGRRRLLPRSCSR